MAGWIISIANIPAEVPFWVGNQTRTEMRPNNSFNRSGNSEAFIRETEGLDFRQLT
jgi:hypothetical protein